MDVRRAFSAKDRAVLGDVFWRTCEVPNSIGPCVWTKTKRGRYEKTNQAFQRLVPPRSAEGFASVRKKAREILKHGEVFRRFARGNNATTFRTDYRFFGRRSTTFSVDARRCGKTKTCENFCTMKTTDSSQLELDGVAGISFLTSAKTAERGDEIGLSPADSHIGNRNRSRAIVRPLTNEKPTVEQEWAEANGLETLLNFAQAARTLGISLRQFRRLVDGGKIAFVKVSERSPRVRPRELQRFLAASVVKYSEVQS